MSSVIYEKKDIYRDPEEDRLAMRKADKRIFYLLLFVTGLVPLLVGGHLTEVISPSISEVSGLSTSYKGDLFTFYKFVFLIIFTAGILLLFLHKVFILHYQFPNNKPLILFGILLAALTLSAIFAPYKTLALFGQYNRTDGTLSYICYIILMFVAMHIHYPQKAVRWILYSFIPFVLINVVLMTMNFTGHDAMTYDSVQKVMSLTLPEGGELGEGSILLGTLNQWNYMSGMFAVMTVLYLSGAMAESTVWRKVLYGVQALISIAIMLMSLSTSGFLTVVLVTFFLIGFAFKLPDKKSALITLLLFFIAVLPVFHVLADKNPRVWDESIGFIISTNPYMPDVTAGLSVSKVYASENSFELPVLPESSMSAGSGRSYIWSKTLELVVERPITGYGLDTLMYHFPHQNIDARGGIGTETVIVDKPHSMYVGMIYGTGIIGFAAFMALIGYVTWKCFSPYLKKRVHLSIQSALGLAWLAFLIQALFNDTLPGTAAPLFAIGGIALALLDKENVREKWNGRNN